MQQSLRGEQGRRGQTTENVGSDTGERGRLQDTELVGVCIMRVKQAVALPGRQTGPRGNNNDCESVPPVTTDVTRRQIPGREDHFRPPRSFCLSRFWRLSMLPLAAAGCSPGRLLGPTRLLQDVHTWRGGLPVERTCLIKILLFLKNCKQLKSDTH